MSYKDMKNAQKVIYRELFPEAQDLYDEIYLKPVCPQPLKDGEYYRNTHVDKSGVKE